MARRSSDPAGDDKAKVRVLFAEVEGNNETVQEALRTMVSAMSRPARIIQIKANGETAALTQQDLEADSVQEALDSDIVTEGTLQSETSVGRKPRGSGTKTDRNAGIALVPDLNFRPQGHPTLRDFFAEKSPSNDMEDILVVVYYMQNQMTLAKIGPSHVLTALKEVGRGIPRDLKQTIRNMKERKVWINFSDIEDVSIATAGDNYVVHEIGKKGQSL
jgi:hypothetical protein